MSDSSETKLKSKTEIKRYRLFLTLFLTLIAIAPTNASSTWTSRATSQVWRGITSCSDGTKLAATVYDGNIWTSTDSGANWESRATSQVWHGITSSSDGTKLAAVVWGGKIWTSTDSGETWTFRATSQDWWDITSSSDGTKLAANVWGGNIWTTDSTTCDASAAPTNGGAGDCTKSLPSGSKCQPECNPGWTVSGMSSCTAGTLTAATCSAPPSSPTGGSSGTPPSQVVPENDTVPSTASYKSKTLALHYILPAVFGLCVLILL